MSGGPGVAIAAPAKINLYLHVTGKRDDGYHLLDSLVVFAGIADRLSLVPAEDGSLTIDGPFGRGIPAGPENLVARAASDFAEAAGTSGRYQIHLTKNLPPASGIGGGSADAAAVLRALCLLNGRDPEAPDMADLALALGADVPVCLAGRPLFFGGIGERLAPAPRLPEAWLVLVNPRVGLSTPAVFRARIGAYSEAGRFAEPVGGVERFAELLAARRNDLTAPAQTLAPVIGDVLAALEALPGCRLARMSGSGATCFGLFAGAEIAQRAAAVLAADHPGWWVEPAPMLTRPEAPQRI